MDNYEIDKEFDYILDDFINNFKNEQNISLETETINTDYNSETNELDDEEITKINKPYRETFVIPIDQLIRIEKNDRN